MTGQPDDPDVVGKVLAAELGAEATVCGYERLSVVRPSTVKRTWTRRCLRPIATPAFGYPLLSSRTHPSLYVECHMVRLLAPLAFDDPGEQHAACLRSRTSEDVSNRPEYSPVYAHGRRPRCAQFPRATGGSGNHRSRPSGPEDPQSPFLHDLDQTDAVATIRVDSPRRSPFPVPRSMTGNIDLSIIKTPVYAIVLLAVESSYQYSLHQLEVPNDAGAPEPDSQAVA